MKKSNVLSIVFALVCVLIFAAEHSNENALQILSQSNSQLRMKLNTGNLEMSRIERGNNTFQSLELRQYDGYNKTATPHLPELPFFSTTIAIPARGDFTITTNEGRVRYVENVLVNPYLEEGEDFDLTAYSQEGVYPARLLEYSEPSVLRDFRIIQISLFPIQYDAGNRSLRISEDIDVTINFNDNPSINELDDYSTYSPIFENLYAATIANFDYYRNTTITPVFPRIQIIHGTNTEASFIQKLNEFVTWKRQKGFEVNVASTQVAGTSNTTIKNYLLAQYSNPNTKPDFIIIIGDTNGSYAVPTWNESYSSYNGEGDYPYTHLAGGDLLGDVFIGRISAENLSQLDVLFSKIYAYEKNIVNTPSAATWLDRILLIGDPSSSGISTIYTNKFIKERAKQLNPDYSFIENYSGGFSSTINSGINQGVAFFNYRGYIGMSSWSPSSSLINGNKLPHAVIITCSTGSFAGGTSTSEAFMRLGTAAAPAGALTAIGMATSGTHTGFNNSLTAGIFDGLLTHNMRTMGEALLSGRMNLYNVYHGSNPTQVSYFAHWCNLMGDPTAEVFISIPPSMNIVAPTNIAMGTHIVDIFVRDDTSNPIPNSAVTIYSAAMLNVVVKGFTDQNGFVALELPSTVTGSLIITASKQNFKPVQFDSMIDPVGAIVYESCIIDDSPSATTSGNSNGVPNPGETVAMSINLKNTTSGTISNLSATIACDDPYVTITQNTSTFSALESNASAFSNSAFIFSVGNNPPAVHDIRFMLSVSDGAAHQYDMPFHVVAINSGFSIQTLNMTAGANNVLDPSENGYLTIAIKNESTLDIEGLMGELFSLNDLVVVNDSLSSYGTVIAGSTVSSADTYVLFARPLLIPGMQMPLRLRLYNAAGFEQMLYFNLSIGTPSVNTPLGPDAYGYFIYDWMDTAYTDCPIYEWQEIHPSLGGSGTLIPLNDAGGTYEEGDMVGAASLAVVNMPFPFTFYGLEYNQMTVCSNGFIAMGITENGDFRNYRLPGPLGPAPMIAAFWDDLVIINDAGVYKHYNENDHTFIIQYHKMRNGYNRTSEETFQIIFYDPMYYPTGLGDGMIKIQYKVFNNVDIGSGGYSPYHGNYSSIGIKDHTNTVGLEYTYNNQYPTPAATLGHEKALLITTKPVLHQSPYLVISETIIQESSGNGIIEPGEEVEIGIKLSNLGMNTAYDVHLNTQIVNNWVTVLSDSSSYNNIIGSSYGININPIKLYISPDTPANTVISLPCSITIEGNSWQYSVSLTVRKPALEVASLLVNDFLGNGNGIMEPGETFKLIVNYANASEVEARNVTSNIFCSDTRVTIHNPELLLNDIPMGTSLQAVYQITLSEDIPLNSYITFYLTYLGELLSPINEQILVSCGTTGMNADFEYTNGAFVSSPATNAWEWGTSTYSGAHSGTKVWGTRLNTQYPNGAIYSLTSPEIYLGQNFALEFYHRYDMEATYDGGNLKISTNNGGSWTLIHPEGGYTNQNLAALGEAGYSGTQMAWTAARFDLSAYSNQNARFKWTFASDNMIQGEGWFIDDVSTSGHIDFASLISGSITSGDPDFQPENVLIKASNNMAVHPTSDASYELFLPLGQNTISAISAGYQTQTSASVTTGLDNPVFVQDFYMGYLSPATNLAFSIVEDNLLLSWTAPFEPEFTPLSYKVYRKINADRFEQIAQIDATMHTEILSDLGNYFYYVTCIYSEGESLPSNVLNFPYPYVNELDENQIPLVTKLYHNYPNPFNPSTTIAFSTKNTGKVKLNVYNIKGQLVRSLVDTNLNAGSHSVLWDGTDNTKRKVSSGIYLYRLETKDYTHTRKAMLMK